MGRYQHQYPSPSYHSDNTIPQYPPNDPDGITVIAPVNTIPALYDTHASEYDSWASSSQVPQSYQYQASYPHAQRDQTPYYSDAPALSATSGVSIEPCGLPPLSSNYCGGGYGPEVTDAGGTGCQWSGEFVEGDGYGTQLPYEAEYHQEEPRYAQVQPGGREYHGRRHAPPPPPQTGPFAQFHPPRYAEPVHPSQYTAPPPPPPHPTYIPHHPNPQRRHQREPPSMPVEPLPPKNHPTPLSRRSRVPTTKIVPLAGTGKTVYAERERCRLGRSGWRISRP